jgi:hypothetical protein
MKGKIAAGIVAGLLAATALIGIVGVAYNAGRQDDHDKVVQVVDRGESTADDEVTTRVVTVDRGWGWRGPGFFGLLFPVLLIVLVVALVTRRHRWGWRNGAGPWGGPGWGGYPPPGPYGTGSESPQPPNPPPTS